jgi:hypothetical protein
VKMVPINRLVPRSFITNISPGETVPRGAPTLVRGIAFGGDCDVATVELSIDGGKTWTPTRLGKDEGKYSFRQWETQLTLPSAGRYTLMVRCTNSNGNVQPDSANWNPAGFMRNVIESMDVLAS